MNDDALASANLLERIGHLSRTDEKAGELNPAQWAALRYLSRANRFSRTPMALSRYLGATRGTTSQTLLALERKGYVLRQANQRDARSIEILLTDKGTATLKHDPIMTLVSSIDATLGKESKGLRANLMRLLETLVMNNGGRKFGECQTCRHFVRKGNATRPGEHYCGLLEETLSASDIEKICAEHA